jgi:hypothetical protein
MGVLPLAMTASGTFYKSFTDLQSLHAFLYARGIVVKGLNATANPCAIAHITVFAVALTAVKIDQKHKIRYVKSLIPKLFL